MRSSRFHVTSGTRRWVIQLFITYIAINRFAARLQSILAVDIVSSLCWWYLPLLQAVTRLFDALAERTGGRPPTLIVNNAAGEGCAL